MLLVNHMTERVVFTGPQPRLPAGVELMAANDKGGAFQLALTRGLGRSDNLPLLQAGASRGPFPGGSWELFRRGSSLAETMSRMRMVFSEQEALAPSDLGMQGLRLKLERTLLERLGTGLDRLLGLEEEVGAERLGAMELWFGEDGRLTGSRVFDADGGLITEAELEYVDVDLAEREVATLMPTLPELEEAAVSASEDLLETPQQLAEPLLSSGWLVLLSVGMLAICVVIVLRLRRSEE